MHRLFGCGAGFEPRPLGYEFGDPVLSGNATELQDTVGQIRDGSGIDGNFEDGLSPRPGGTISRTGVQIHFFLE